MGNLLKDFMKNARGFERTTTRRDGTTTTTKVDPEDIRAVGDVFVKILSVFCKKTK